MPKFDDLCVTVANFKPDVVMITESWLSNDVQDELLAIPCYTVLRTDRQCRRGGGVCTWIRDKYRCVIFVPSFQCPSSIEALFSEVFVGTRRIFFCNVYVPPGLLKDTHDEINIFLTNVIDEVLNLDCDANVIVGGDFNDFSTRFLQEQFNLTNKVREPTRASAILDQIWIDDELCAVYKESAEIGPPLKNSDHNSVFLLPSECSDQSCILNHVPVWDFRASYLDAFLCHLQRIDFGVLRRSDSVDDAVDKFYHVLHECASIIPCEVVSFSPKDKPWITPLLKLLIGKRWDAYRQKNWQLFNHYRLRVNKEKAKAKRLWADRESRTSKGMWNVVRSIRGKQAKDPVDNLLHDYSGIEELIQGLTTEFVGNYNFAEDVSLLPTEDVTWNISVSPLDVFNALEKLNSRKAIGPDGIPTKLLIAGAHLICEPLSFLFNWSIQSKVFPSAFKATYICPIAKKMSPTVKDFRPISLLPVLGKIFEKLVLERVREELLTCYHKRQHAYRPLGSTTSALVDVHNKVTEVLDSRDSAAVRIICLDLSKAFDGLQFHRLLNFLKLKGINQGFLRWLASYLTDRQFRIKIKGCLGQSTNIPSGVPQGSVLGPYLFAAFMGSLNFDSSTVYTVQYADDVTLIEATNAEDQVVSLDSIVSEFYNAGLCLNRRKCKQIVFRKSVSSVFSANDLLEVDYVRILGITFSNSLSWHKQFSEMLKRASRRLYIVRSLKSFLSKKRLTLIYHSLITSLFVYASPVYGRVPLVLMNKLEKFQNRAHRMICGRDCQCTNFPPICETFDKHAVKLLKCCESDRKHPLHELVPPRFERTRHFRIACSSTSRRLHSFFPWITIMINNQSLNPC